MQTWAAVEMRTLALGDQRRVRRCVQVLDALAARPEASVPQACGSWAATKGTYRFWDSAFVSADAIRAAHRDATVGRIIRRERIGDRPRVLVLQDTTSLDLTHHPAIEDVGPLAHPAHSGVWVHSEFAASLSGVPLGLLAQQVWARDAEAVGSRHTRRARPTDEKESQKWLTGLAATEAALPEDVGIITVADREADVYDLFAAPRRAGSELLIRAVQNRAVTSEAGYLWETIETAPVVGTTEVTVSRRPDHPARTARLSVRVAATAIQPPRHHPQRRQQQPIPVSVILAEEVDAPDGVTPVRWLLVTTLAVLTRDEAVQCLDWYALRWLIERYHYVLKSGCGIEQLQLGTAERLERALATYSVVAWRLLFLTYQARATPEVPCTVVLTTSEWQALWLAHVGTAHGTAVPDRPPTLGEAVSWIAQLGGHLARRHDGPPGVKTLWRGWQRLMDLTAMYELLTPQANAVLSVGNA